MLEAPWVGVVAKEAAKKDEHRGDRSGACTFGAGGAGRVVNSTSIPTLCPRQSNLLTSPCLSLHSVQSVVGQLLFL